MDKTWRSPHPQVYYGHLSAVCFPDNGGQILEVGGEEGPVGGGQTDGAGLLVTLEVCPPDASHVPSERMVQCNQTQLGQKKTLNLIYLLGGVRPPRLTSSKISWDQLMDVCVHLCVFVCVWLLCVSREMKWVFDHSVRGMEARKRLLALRQGSAPVSQNAIDFCILAAESDWDEEVLQTVLLNGLSESVMDKSGMRLPLLEELIYLVVRLDDRLRERCRAKAGIPDPFFSPSSPICPPEVATAMAAGPTPAFQRLPTADSGEPIQLEGTRLTPVERHRRISTWLCIHCGQPGHFLATCPQRPKSQSHQPLEGLHFTLQPSPAPGDTPWGPV